MNTEYFFSLRGDFSETEEFVNCAIKISKTKVAGISEYQVWDGSVTSIGDMLDIHATARDLPLIPDSKFFSTEKQPVKVFKICGILPATALDAQEIVGPFRFQVFMANDQKQNIDIWLTPVFV